MTDDDPELDSTDFAHPAWWRGSDHAVEMVVQLFKEAIEGKDEGAGNIGHPGLEEIRRWILEHRPPDCGYCREPIADTSKAPRITFVGTEGQRIEYCHPECLQRQVIGGFNHLKGTCTCCGGTEPPDPPGLSKYEAAIMAVHYWRLTNERD